MAGAGAITPEELPVGWLRLDVRGVIEAANPRIAAWTGHPVESLLGKSFDTLLTSGSRLLYQCYVQPLLRLHADTAEISIMLRSADGGEISALLYSCRTGRDGVDLVIAPIQRRRKIEDELLRVKRAADVAPGMMFQLVQPAPGQLRFVYASQSARTLFGCAPEELQRDPAGVFDRIAAPDRLALEAAMSRSVHTGEPLSLPVAATGPDGSARMHEWQAVPRQLANGVQLWSGYVSDITDRQLLAHAQAEQASALKLARYRSEFLARANHEMRTPLNAILGFAQILGRSEAGALSSEQRSAVKILESSGRHMLQLVNQLLDLARLEQDDQPLALEPIGLAGLVQEVLDGLGAAIAQRGLSIRAQVAPETRVLSERVRLAQVLANLLSNAVKYNRDGGDIRIETAARADGRLQISVHDSGAGLLPEQLSQLFQPFNRLGAERSAVPGTGLGLTICRQLVHGFGGQLTVDSVPGTGSCFSFDLPQPLLGTEPGPGLHSAALGPAESLRPRDVLYVEDNEVNVLLMSAMLGLRPHLRLRVAVSGREALRLAAESPPDILLLDYHLPDCNGIELLEQLRELPELHRTPAVLVTAVSEPMPALQAQGGGFHALWTKPLDVDDVINGLREIEQLLPD